MHEFIDHGESGARGDRPELRRLFESAARCEIDIVIFWALDRLTREGAAATLEYLAQLGRHGVRFRSFTEPYLDSSGVWGDAIIAILATIAKQERIRIRAGPWPDWSGQGKTASGQASRSGGHEQYFIETGSPP